jgi:hypothetical protein
MSSTVDLGKCGGSQRARWQAFAKPVQSHLEACTLQASAMLALRLKPPQEVRLIVAQEFDGSGRVVQ